MVANLNLSERQNIYIIAVLFPTSEGNLTDQNDHTALPYLVKDQALISPNHQRLSNYAPYFLELPNWAALPFYSTLLEKIVENWNFNEYSLHPVSKYSWKFKFSPIFFSISVLTCSIYDK